jgi:toluene monooxygenase system protein E
VLSQKTYWHLLDKQRLPSEYELVSSHLHYYVGRGFEVHVPLQPWYQQYQQGSPFTCRNWEQFADPRQTTYATYTGLQAAKETFVDGLLAFIEDTGYDQGLSATWLRILARAFAPFRYPCHALHMVACYIGQMGPSGRITLAGMFQAADELRRVHRLAYRLRQLQLSHPGLGADSKALWQQDGLWQPLREAVERLLVTYDWGEAFAALNLVLKPLLDGLFLVHVGRLAQQEGDYVLPQLFTSLHTDCQWQRQWSQALVRTALQDTPDNQQVLQQWVDKWSAAAVRAVRAFAPLFEHMPAQPESIPFAQVIAQLDASLQEHLTLAGLQKPPLDWYG